MYIVSYKDRVIETVSFLKNELIKNKFDKLLLSSEKSKELPEIAFLTGTGLANSTSSMDLVAKLSYKDIPNFPISTVESHQGELLFGTISNRKIMVMQGRFHLYEGYSPLDVTFPIRVMQELGVKYLIISNASGGLNLNFSVGDIMVIRDHINLTGNNPLVGKNVDDWGVRFPDMTKVYDKELTDSAFYYAHSKSIPIQEGVYAGLCGPSLETPAETRFLKTIGADAVGFSTVMEAIAGSHAGMRIVGLATITNINNPDSPQMATVEDIIKIANKSSEFIHEILKGIIEMM